MKTREEVEQLKRDWLQDDCCYELENTEGFEEYKDELKYFRLDCEERRSRVYKNAARRRFFEEPAHAAPASFWGDGSQEHALQPGLTKREYFAAAAMQGLLSDGRVDYDGVAVIALKMADAVIDRLYNTEP